MNADLQKVQKQTGQQPASNAEPLTVETGGFDSSQVLPSFRTPPTVITPAQVKQMQRMVGNHATISRLAAPAASRGQTQCQDGDSLAAIQTKINGMNLGSIDSLLGILGKLLNGPTSAAIPVSIEGNTYRLSRESREGLVNAGKSRLTELLVESVNTYDAPTLNAFLRNRGISRVASGAPDAPAAAIQVALPGRKAPLPLTPEQANASVQRRTQL